MTNNYAIIENAVVANVATSTPEFAQEQGWVLLTGDAWIGWGYSDGQFVPPPPPDYSQQNKAQAESLLQATDWTENPSARNTEKTPHLVNGDAFDDYRVALRAIAVDAPETQVTDWPVKPDEVWSE